MDITIRRATVEDIPLIAKLDNMARAELAELAAAGFAEGLKSPLDTAEMHYELQEAFDEGSTTILLAEHAGQPAGYCRLWLEEHGDDLIPAPFLTIEQIGVASALRGKGVARALLVEAESVARELGAVALELSVLEGNAAARTLYESLAYTSLERRMAKLL